MIDAIESLLSLTQQKLVFFTNPITENSRLVVICPIGHCYVTNWLLLQRGVYCPTCQGQLRYGKDDISTTCGLFGYELLSDSYENNKQKLSFKCDKGHIFEMSWLNLSQGHRCPTCRKNKVLLEDVAAFASEHGHELVTKGYINNRFLLDFHCKKGHRFKKSWHSYKRCPKCPLC